MRMAVGVVVAVAGLAASRNAAGYLEKEHQYLGTEGYRLACQAVKDTVNAAQWEKVADYCAENWAVLYGQVTKLAGDHFGDRELLNNNLGQVAKEANSFTNYVDLATKNDSHFHPENLRRYSEIRADALASAERFAGATDAFKRDEYFRNAFYANAFADHFLEDSFAPGHAGFSRSSSNPNESKLVHDALNARGNFLRDRRGRHWLTYGDGKLMEAENAEGRKRLLVAGKLSIAEVLYRAATGKSHEEWDEALLDSLPQQMLVVDVLAVTSNWSRSHLVLVHPPYVPPDDCFEELRSARDLNDVECSVKWWPMAGIPSKAKRWMAASFGYTYQGYASGHMAEFGFRYGHAGFDLRFGLEPAWHSDYAELSDWLAAEANVNLELPLVSLYGQVFEIALRLGPSIGLLHSPGDYSWSGTAEMSLPITARFAWRGLYLYLRPSASAGVRTSDWDGFYDWGASVGLGQDLTVWGGGLL